LAAEFRSLVDDFMADFGVFQQNEGNRQHRAKVQQSCHLQ